MTRETARFDPRASLRTLAPAFALALALIASGPDAFAWGRRGHAAIAETAAMIAADRKPGAAVLRDRAFDLGYYANVPDLVWKGPETYETERTNHFMDLEIFARAFKARPDERKPYELDRAAFEARFPEIERKAGRAYWRVRELTDRLGAISTELRDPALSREKRHQRQAEWLVVAGAIGHYVGDLCQPLHVTENHDGQLTGQKGIHVFFENAVVNDYPPGELEHSIGREAKLRAPAFFKRSAGKPLQTLLEELTESSNRNLGELLRIDKRLGRKNVSKARAAYARMQIERMALGSLYLAEIWTRATGWPYDGEKFFTFIPAPAFLPPGPPSADPPAMDPAPAASTPAPSAPSK